MQAPVLYPAPPEPEQLPARQMALRAEAAVPGDGRA